MKRLLLCTVACGCILGSVGIGQADLCFSNPTTAKQYVLLKVSSKAANAKGKVFGGYHLESMGMSMGPIFGTAITQTSKSTLALSFVEPQIAFSDSGSVSGGNNTFHTIVFDDGLGDNDQNWGVGETATDCYRSDGGIIAACNTVTAVDCADLTKP